MESFNDGSSVPDANVIDVNDIHVIELRTHYKSIFGHKLAILGDCATFGKWNPEHALFADEYKPGFWKAKAEFPSTHPEPLFKWAAIPDQGKTTAYIHWENDPNRNLLWRDAPLGHYTVINAQFDQEYRVISSRKLDKSTYNRRNQPSPIVDIDMSEVWSWMVPHVHFTYEKDDSCLKDLLE